ncbi:MAG: hypothetical protein ACJ71C_02685 [Nitrososphaeraceae archaeon]
MTSIMVIAGHEENDNNNNNNIENADNDDLSISLTTTALAQTINSNKTQLWMDKENNAKIIFMYNPENPIIGKSTKLLFSLQDLHTGDEIKEGLHARIIITNGQDILKITNSTFVDGNFSINYAFPDSGSYQVISKIDTKNITELASFNVFVPPQGLSSSSKSFVNLMLYYVIPATSSAAGIAIYLSHKKRSNID